MKVNIRTALIALVVSLGCVATSATATTLITSSQIKDGTIQNVDIHKGSVSLNRLTPNVQRLVQQHSSTNTVNNNGTNGANGANGSNGLQGAKGDTGETGVTGAQGPKGATGDAVMSGAYYSVAYYDVGNTNAGAIATVACSAETDTAISGGVQTVGLDATANSRNTPVSSSFPGRMDWTVNAPKANRLDGWIVQFGGNAGAASDKDPLKVKVWALCVPGLSTAVSATYTQSIDG